jgi:hypothetical protein
MRSVKFRDSKRIGGLELVVVNNRVGVSCWRLNILERLKVLWTGRIYHYHTQGGINMKTEFDEKA